MSSPNEGELIRKEFISVPLQTFSRFVTKGTPAFCLKTYTKSESIQAPATPLVCFVQTCLI